LAAQGMKGLFRRASTPLAFYYAITLAVPWANGAAGSAFLEHALVVLAVPPALIMLFCAVRASMLLAFVNLIQLNHGRDRARGGKTVSGDGNSYRLVDTIEADAESNVIATEVIR